MSNRPAMQSGSHHQLGAHWDGEGVNFALFAAHAEAVELCIYDTAGTEETGRYRLPEQTHDVWHGYLPELAPGAAYGYRVYGPYDPHAGHRFNHHKLLLDPYARELKGSFTWSDTHFAYRRDADQEDLSFDERDSAAWMPKCVVTGRPGSDQPARPSIPWHETIIYEAHVRGYTLRHPEVPELQRGKFGGMSDDNVIAYLKALGITAVELMPVQAFIDQHFLHRKGLRNYWGYNTANFFTPPTGAITGAPGPRNSGRWSINFTTQGWKCCWTLSITTPLRAITWVLRSVSAGSTTRPTIVCRPSSPATT